MPEWDTHLTYQMGLIFHSTRITFFGDKAHHFYYRGKYSDMFALLFSVTPLSYRAVTRVFHPCLSLAHFWSVSKLLSCLFISVYTVRRQETLGYPFFHFPSGVQKRAVFIILSESLLST